MFASAGILWGVVTVYRGIREWYREQSKTSFQAIIAVGAALAISCLGFLVHQL